MSETATATPPAQANTPAAASTPPPATPPATPQQAPAAVVAPPAQPAAKAEAEKAVVQTKRELKLPEGSPLGQGDVERIAAEAAQRGLSNTDAQALLERESKAVASYSARQLQQLADEGERWKEQASVDPEVGGARFDENKEHAKRFIDRYGSDDLKRALKTTGLANHPEFFRLCVRAGKASREDTLVTSGLRGVATKRDPAALLFPNSGPKQKE